MFNMSDGNNATLTNKVDKGVENDLGMEGAREGLSDFQWEVTFGQRQWNKVSSCTEIWMKSIVGRENSRWRGPEVGACLECFRNNKEAYMAETGWARWKVMEDESSWEPGHIRSWWRLALILSDLGSHWRVLSRSGLPFKRFVVAAMWKIHCRASRAEAVRPVRKLLE